MVMSLEERVNGSPRIKKEDKRLLVCFDETSIEHLGAQHLGGLARDLGWDRRYLAVPNRDYRQLFSDVEEYKPSVVLISIYTGNHKETFAALDRLREEHPEIKTVLGGPHATYFPEEAEKHVDHVVMSEGFEPLKRILKEMTRPEIVKKVRRFATKKAPDLLTPILESRGKSSTLEKLLKLGHNTMANPFRLLFGYDTPQGIQQLAQSKRFPVRDAEQLYKQYVQYAKSSIKSIIGTTGCPYKCTYCYNSSTPADLALNPELAKQMAVMMGAKDMGGTRLFPSHLRNVDDLIREAVWIMENCPETDKFYFQDDVLLANPRHRKEFKKRWKREVGTPFHGQARMEMVTPQYLDDLMEAGLHGLTAAIESDNYVVRRDVLDRKMPDEIIFKALALLAERGINTRTEQIGMLPLGATNEETPINLEAFLNLLEFNVRLRKETGAPTQAWSSIYAPYLRTKLGIYSVVNGHYQGDNNDVSDSFFVRPVLRFPKEYIGPSMAQRKDDPGIWLPHDELEELRDQSAELRDHFQFFVGIPEGDKLASEYLTSPGEYGYRKLGHHIEKHLKGFERRWSDSNDLDAQQARDMLGNIDILRKYFAADQGQDDDSNFNGYSEDLQTLAPYFACIPKADLAIERVVDYSSKSREKSISRGTLSKAVRHHLYDEILYEVSSPYNEGNGSQRILIDERYTPKV